MVLASKVARFFELEEGDDLFRVREKASVWLDGAAWRDASKIHAGDWSSFFASPLIYIAREHVIII